MFSRTQHYEGAPPSRGDRDGGGAQQGGEWEDGVRERARGEWGVVLHSSGCLCRGMEGSAVDGGSSASPRQG